MRDFKPLALFRVEAADGCNDPEVTGQVTPERPLRRLVRIMPRDLSLFFSLPRLLFSGRGTVLLSFSLSLKTRRKWGVCRLVAFMDGSRAPPPSLVFPQSRVCREKNKTEGGKNWKLRSLTRTHCRLPIARSLWRVVNKLFTFPKTVATRPNRTWYVRNYGEVWSSEHSEPTEAWPEMESILRLKPLL